MDDVAHACIDNLIYRSQLGFLSSSRLFFGPGQVLEESWMMPLLAPFWLRRVEWEPSCVCVCQLPSLSSCSSILVVPFQESRENHFYGYLNVGIGIQFYCCCTRKRKIILTINLSFPLLTRIHSWWVHLVPTAIYKKKPYLVSLFMKMTFQRETEMSQRVTKTWMFILWPPLPPPPPQCQALELPGSRAQNA